MILTHSFKTSATRAIVLCSFSLLSVLAASCGKSSSSPAGGGDIGPSGDGTAANNLLAIKKAENNCGAGIDFCLYEEVANQFATVTFQPDAGTIPNFSVNLDPATSSADWNLTQCPTSLTEPCVATLTYKPTAAAAAADGTVTLDYNYKNNKLTPGSGSQNFKYTTTSLQDGSKALSFPLTTNLNTWASMQSNVVSSLEPQLFVLTSASATGTQTPENILYSSIPTVNNQHFVTNYSLAQYSAENPSSKDSYVVTTFMMPNGAGGKKIAASSAKTTAEGGVVDLNIPSTVKSSDAISVGKNATYFCTLGDGGKIFYTQPGQPDPAGSFALPDGYPTYMEHCFQAEATSGSDNLYVFSYDHARTGDTSNFLSRISYSFENGITAVATSAAPVLPESNNLDYFTHYKTSDTTTTLLVTSHNRLTKYPAIGIYTEDDTTRQIVLAASYAPQTEEYIQGAPAYDAANNVIYIVTSSNYNNPTDGYTLRSINATTGTENWGTKPKFFTTKTSAPFLTLNGNVVVVSADGNIYSYKPGKTGPESAFNNNFYSVKKDDGFTLNFSAASLDNNLLRIPASSETATKVYAVHTDW